MGAPKLYVNLDAMIGRADFAQISDDDTSYETITGIAIHDLTPSGLTGKLLRKPDFQRETNHWTAEQVVSLLECFVNGDLIPSVILWKSPTYLFVIDGGHRLSVLKAWALDDYGDGPESVKYFGDGISVNQKKAAAKARKLIAERVGTYQHIKTRIENGQIDSIASSTSTRILPIQWVKGDAEKAESSFFKINTQGTPLDYIEESLLKDRKKPIPIAARAIIRAGGGHKYWSRFSVEKTRIIETTAKKLHLNLFEPELKTPVKTLDLPLGGAKGIRAALQIIIDYLQIANISQTEKYIKINHGGDDETGDKTIDVLRKTETLTNWITGNDKGSLGLHPAIFYYGPTGVHSSPLFLGTARFISEKLANNDKTFFREFTLCRANIESALISHKELIATVIQKLGSARRVIKYSELINSIYSAAKKGEEITEEKIVDWAGLAGKIIVGKEKTNNTNFTDEVKSSIFINAALKTAIKCEICGGYLDSEKSVSYDHIIRKEDNGTGEVENGQLTHPYCNQAIKG